MKNKNIKIFLILFFGLLVSGVCLANIRQVGPAEFNEAVNFNEREFVLNGAGLKKFLTIKIVSVGLYVEKGSSADNILAEKAKRLEVVYLQNIPKSELDRATIKGIKKNVDNQQYKILEARIDQINSYYPDVTPQDRIEITYIPGRGTEVALNGNKKGIVEGDDFAWAFFSIWVGEKPVDKKMKRILLGETKESES